MSQDIRIEYPSQGITYSREEYGVYKYTVFGRGSVLEGQQCREFVESFETLAEAQAEYPDAESSGCGYSEPYLDHLPDGPDLR